MKLLFTTLKRFLTLKSIDGAAVLSFSTILTMVPTLALALHIFSLSSHFNVLEDQFEYFIYRELLPESYDIVEEYLHIFIGKTKNLTLFSIIFLAVSSILLFAEIDNKVNAVWPIEQKRNQIISFTSYFFILFIGPLLLSLTLLISSSITLLSPSLEIWLNTHPLTNHLFASFISVIPFTIFFYITPVVKVRFKTAFKTALLTVFLLEILRLSITFYIKVFPAYHIIYGAFAALPLFMLWVFLSWCIILFSAHYCYHLDNPPPEKTDK